MKKILAISLSAFLASCGGSNDSTGVPSLRADGTVVSNGASDTSASDSALESRAFIMNAFQDSTAEIELSRIALQKASDSDVKKFAQRMIDDHTQANNEMQALAQTKGISLPAELAPDRRTAQENMAALSGTEFDRAYMMLNVSVHEQDVAQSRAQADAGTDADVKTFAANTLPALQVHLFAAKTINGKISPSAFLMNAYVDGRAEIQLSTLALQQASDPAVKQFAQKMIDDHTSANNDIAQLAQEEDISLPADLTVEHRLANADLSRMSGMDFDKAYMNHNVLVHALGVLQAGGQAQSGTDKDIRIFAIQTLPVLSWHLQMGNDLYEKLGASLPFEAFKDGMGEILLSKLALQKSSDVEVQQFAQRMINDHTAANNQILALAEAKNFALQREISPGQLRDYLRLSRLVGNEFDRGYMRRNVDVHAKDTQLFEQAAASEPDADIKAFAAANLPVLSAHLASARQIDSRLNSAAP